MKIASTPGLMVAILMVAGLGAGQIQSGCERPLDMDRVFGGALRSVAVFFKESRVLERPGS